MFAWFASFSGDNGENNTAQNDSFENHAQMKKVPWEVNFESYAQEIERDPFLSTV